MHRLTAIIVLLCCAAFCLSAGCVQPAGQPAAPPATATTPAAPATAQTPVQMATTPVIPANNLVPKPTDEIPSQYAVEIQVDKNTVATNPAISVVFRGGNGQTFTETMAATVMHPDGSSDTKSARKPQVGTTLNMPGTTGTDRVTVAVTLVTGDTYTVIDTLMPFQPLSPP